MCDPAVLFSLPLCVCVQVCLAGGERQSGGEELTATQKVTITLVYKTALQVEQGFIEGSHIITGGWRWPIG